MDKMKLKKLFNSDNIIFIFCAIVKIFCAIHHGFNENVALCILWGFLALFDIVLVKLNIDGKMSNNSK